MNPYDVISTATVPSSILTHYVASASIVAWIMYQKYELSVPLYRQERDFKRMGTELKRDHGILAHPQLRVLAEITV